jgi:serine/threonine protein kinase
MISVQIGRRGIISVPQKIGDYNVKRAIAVGGTSVVVKAENIPNGDQVALKVMNTKQCLEDGGLIDLEQELNIINRISHPNIVHTHHIIQEGDLIVIAMEYCPDNLVDWITKGPRISEYAALYSFHQIARAIQYLHELNIYHGDIKLDNILMDEEYIPKLADIGYASMKLYKSGKKRGTLIYAAPQLFLTGYADMRAADIWSFGIVPYAMIANRFPYPRGDEIHLMNRIRHGILDYKVIENDQIRALVMKMTSVNPSKRPTISDVINEVADLIAFIEKRQIFG